MKTVQRAQEITTVSAYVRKSAACVGTADFEAGGWDGRRPVERKNCGHSYVLGRAGQLFTPLGRYAARDLAPAALNGCESRSATVAGRGLRLTSSIVECAVLSIIKSLVGYQSPVWVIVGKWLVSRTYLSFKHGPIMWTGRQGSHIQILSADCSTLVYRWDL